MSNEEDEREQGVELGDLEGTIDGIDYPIDHEDLVDRHGDAELELPDGTSTLAEVLAPLQDQDQTYHDADELETMIMNMVGDDAIGRKNYSDRGDELEQAEGDQEESI